MRPKPWALLRAAVIAAVVTGYAATPRAADAPPAPSSDDSYYLLQIVSPPKATISIAQGKIVDGAYHADGTVFVTQTFKGTATDGFVFAKAEPGTTQGIRVIRMSDSMFASVYFPCQGDFKTLAFDTQKGKVVYAGTVQYEYATEDGKIAAAYGQDIDAARAFLKSHYPLLADMSQWGAFNKVYLEYFKPPHLPTRSAFGANGLALGACVELEARAYRANYS